MGGVWSGKRWSKKPVVEGCKAIDTADLKRWKLLVPGTTNQAGSLTWGKGNPSESSVGYLLTVGDTDGTLRFQYRMTASNESLDYSARLVTTGCHLGGRRWWFICPLTTNGVRCGRRVRKLYLRGKYFGCRRCHGLTYTSSQESDSRVYRAIRNGCDIPLGDPGRMSVSELSFTLKVLTFERKRLDRLGKRFDRKRGRKSATENPNKP